jgi:hypothetical protein
MATNGRVGSPGIGRAAKAKRVVERCAEQQNEVAQMSNGNRCMVGRATMGRARGPGWGAAIGSILLLMSAGAARAHIDPAVCEVVGVSIVLEAYRADRVTRISLTETVTDCEEICFRSVLSKPLPSQGSPDLVCAFEDGMLSITTPDGAEHDVTPPAGIPCVGGKNLAEGCNPATMSVTSDFQCYVVTTEQAAAGAITISTAYVDGTSHSAPDDILDLVSAGTALQLETDRKCQLDECNTGRCDTATRRCIPVPNSTPCGDADGTVCTMAGCEVQADGQTSVCVQRHVLAPNSTPCEDLDSNLCTMAGCEAGSCVQTHNMKTCATDQCNTGRCNPQTGRCVPQPDSTPCGDTDGTTCSIAGCETLAGGETATCVQRHLTAQDSTPCEELDGNLCTTAGCEAGACVQTHVAKPCATDECNTGQCNPGTGQCVPHPDSTPCTDRDGTVCTIAGCEVQPGGATAVCDQRHNDAPNSARCEDTDGESCTMAGCEVGVCVQRHVLAPNSTPCADSDGNQCTMAGCEAGSCVQTHNMKTCTQDQCNTGQCNPTSGLCVPRADSTPCGETDGTVCTIAGCEVQPGAETAVCAQDHVLAADSTPCEERDANACTMAGCEAGACQQTHIVKTCTQDECNTGVCDAATGDCVPEPDSTPCGDTDGAVCTIAGCEVAPGGQAAVCVQDHLLAENSTPCEESDGVDCTTAGCNGAGTCDQEHINECTGGCRLTGGGVTPDGGVDQTEMAENITGRFGGQVGAPCGCIGCFDEFDHVQGNWQFSRKKQKGNFHAKDYNSLICGCDGVFDGELCNRGQHSKGDGLGPEPRPAPANMACFSGVGDYTMETGNRTLRVGFRTEVEDRGEPGVGDVMRIRIWIPTGNETPESLAAQVCCTVKTPQVRQPDIDDGGDITHGNLQIHPMLTNTLRGRCPVPDGSCVQSE